MIAPADPAELARWRADTPAAGRRVHLNNAGASLVTRQVRQAIDEYLDLEAELGGYEAADASQGALEGVYDDLGRLVGAARRNIALSQNSTTAFAQALGAFDFAPGDTILTTRADYASNQIMYLSLAGRLGVDVVRAPDLPEGGVDPDAVRQAIARRRPTLVSVTWVPTNSGLVQPVAEIGEICRLGGGAVPDRRLPGGRPAAGGRGGAALRLPGRHRTQVPAGTTRDRLPLRLRPRPRERRPPAAGGHARRHLDRSGQVRAHPGCGAGSNRGRSPYALVMGVGAAVRYAIDVGLATARDRARALAAYARERLAELPGVRVLDRGRELGAIVTAAPGTRPAADVKLALRARGINTSSPDRSDAVIDMDDKGAASAIRLSPHYYNTAAEIDTAVEALGDLLSGGGTLSASP